MGLYFGETELTGLYFGDIELTGLYFGDIEIWAAWAEYDGTLPAQYTANGSMLGDYRIYGSAGGVGDDSGTAYGYEVDMSVESVNLFDKSNCDPRTNVYLNSMGSVMTLPQVISQWTISDYIPITPNVSTYTASGLSVGGNSTYCCVYDSNKIFRRSYLITANQNVSITTQPGDAYVRLSVRLINNEIDTAMFTIGSTVPSTYIPYSSTTTPIYIGDTPLNANGGYADYVDYQSQKIKRRIKTRIFDGSETFTLQTTNVYALPITDMINDDLSIAYSSNYYTWWQWIINGAQFNSAPDKSLFGFRNYGLYIKDTGYASVADFKNHVKELYDAGTPLTVTYVTSEYYDTDPPVPLPQLPTVDGTTITDYAGIATVETETNNIMPSAAAETKTVGNTTVTCDGHGRYHVTKSGSGDDYVSFNVPEFTIPISVAGGGNGTVSFFNTMSDKAAVAFYYGSSRIDSWNMNSANRQTNSYGTMAGQVCNKIEINAWGSSTWTGDINIMFTNDGVLPTAFIPHIVETAKPRPSRFYSKYKKG